MENGPQNEHDGNVDEDIVYVLYIGDSEVKGKKSGLLFSTTTNIGLGISFSFAKNRSPCGHYQKSKDFHAKILIGRIINPLLRNVIKWSDTL